MEPGFVFLLTLERLRELLAEAHDGKVPEEVLFDFFEGPEDMPFERVDEVIFDDE